MVDNNIGRDIFGNAGDPSYAMRGGEMDIHNMGGSRVVCEPSYVPVENLVLGRMAFKGMKQEIETMVTDKVAPEDNEVSDADMATYQTLQEHGQEIYH